LKFIPEFKEIEFEKVEELIQKWRDYVYALEQQSLEI
jgi:hypothetical protein